MTFAAALRAFLMADPAISGYVQGRVFPGAIPPPGSGQAWAGDALSYSLIGATPSASVNKDRLEAREWEIAAVSEDYERAHELADLVAVRLNYFSGGMGGVRVMSCLRQSMSDAHDFEFGLFAVVSVFDVQYLKPNN